MYASHPASGEIIPTSGKFEMSEYAGIISITGSGLWDVEIVDAHFRELAGVLSRVRREQPTPMILVDLRGSIVQPVAVFERLSWWTHQIYVPRDRIAIIVATSLQKVQMRRVETRATRELFLSMEAARTWLVAHQ